MKKWQQFKQRFALKKSTDKLFNPTRAGFGALDAYRVIGMSYVVAAHTLALFLYIQSERFDKPMVEIFNSMPWYVTSVSNAHFFIDGFFLLSGFLIAGILFREYNKNTQINIKSFYFRRFMRLMPTYAFVIMIFYLSGYEHRDKLWQNILYINNFFEHRDTAMQWTWSLAVEEQFYLVFPLFVTALIFNKKHFITGLFVLFGLSFLIRGLILFQHPMLADNPISIQLTDVSVERVFLNVLYDNLYTRYGAFLCGIYASYLYVYKKQAVIDFFHNKKIAPFIVLSCYIILSIIVLISWHKMDSLPQWAVHVYYIAGRNIFSVAAAVLMLGLIVGGKYLNLLKYFFDKKFWYPYAQLTYSAYLIHVPIAGGVVLVLQKLLIDVLTASIIPPLWIFILAIAITMFITYIFCFLIFIFIESPLMTWRDLRSGESFRNQAAD